MTDDEYLEYNKWKRLQKRDYAGVEYTDVMDEFYRQEDEILEEDDFKWLRFISRNRLACDSRDIGRDFTSREMDTLLHDLQTSRMVEYGYVVIGTPQYHTDPDHRLYADEEDEGFPYVILIPARLTDIGKMALRYASQDVYWSITYHRPLYEMSQNEWGNYLDGARYENAESVFRRIESLGHPMFDHLKERIPDKRAAVWRNYLSRCWPNDSAWSSLRVTQLLGLDEIKRDRVALQRARWKATIPNITMVNNNLFNSARLLDPTEFPDVIAEAHDRHVALWIDEVQKITNPESKLFAEVDALPERFDLVKAEAFLQKMKCWTPLDEKGRRT